MRPRRHVGQERHRSHAASGYPAHLRHQVPERPLRRCGRGDLHRPRLLPGRWRVWGYASTSVRTWAELRPSGRIEHCRKVPLPASPSRLTGSCKAAPRVKPGAAGNSWPRARACRRGAFGARHRRRQRHHTAASTMDLGGDRTRKTRTSPDATVRLVGSDTVLPSSKRADASTAAACRTRPASADGPCRSTALRLSRSPGEAARISVHRPSEITRRTLPR